MTGKQSTYVKIFFAQATILVHNSSSMNLPVTNSIIHRVDVIGHDAIQELLEVDVLLNVLEQGEKNDLQIGERFLTILRDDEL